MEVVSKEQTVSAILFALALSLFVLWIAIYAGFFRLPKDEGKNKVRLSHVIVIFLLYLGLNYIFFPIALAILALFLGINQTSPSTVLSAFLVFFLFLFCILLGYCFLISKESRHVIFWGGKKAGLRRFFIAIGMAIITLLIAYPLVLLANVISADLIFRFWGEYKLEQEAIRQLKLSANYPILFFLMGFIVVFLVPFLEELLFRGFLQSYLRSKLGRIGAIILTAAIFAFFHFSLRQGIGNIQLISTLFVLSCFIGFIYERQQTLWAPYIVHLVFNLNTLIAIAISAFS